MGSGMRASELMTNNSLPPCGTLICGQGGASPVLQTSILRCGPAPSSGNPRSESPPPVKNASLRGTRLLAYGWASPMRMLPAQTIPWNFSL